MGSRLHYAKIKFSFLILLFVSWASSVTGAQDPNRQLCNWSESGQFKAIQNLLGENREVDVNWRNESGWTALMYAAKGGHDDIIQILLDAGANPHLENDDKETAMLLAAANGQTEAVRLLLAAGADFDSPDVYGRTPLFRAIEHRNAETIELLQAAAQRAASERIRLVEENLSKEETMPPVIIESEPAPYTDSALEQGVEGTVVLMVLVRRDGSIGGISVSKSLEESLDQSAVRAVRRWKFEPATRGGTAVNVVVEIPIDFKPPTNK